MGLLDALQDKGFRNDVADGLRNALNRGLLGGVLGAPVDLATMALRPLGYKVAQPIGGSDWIGQKLQDAGMVSTKRNQLAETLAGLLDPATMATGAIKAAAAAPMVAGMFIGKGAKTWDALQATKALELEKAGTPARQIWSETGTWKGPDGMWRQEIPDNQALFNPSTVAGKRVQNDLPIGYAGLDLGPTVGGILEHQPLQAAYGSKLTAGTRIGNKNTMFGDGVQGAYDPGTGTMTINAPAKAADARSTTLHEIQHAIQQQEGFATGGSSASFPGSQAVQDAQIIRNLTDKGMKPSEAATWFKNKLGRNPSIEVMDLSFHPDLAKMGSPEQSYRRLAGEAEARATQTRIPLDASQRRAIFPEDSYDVPVNQLIVRGLLDR